MDTRVRAGGDESLDLHAFARQMMFVSITIVRSDAPSVPERWRGQVLHGVPGCARAPVRPGLHQADSARDALLSSGVLRR